MALHPEVQKRAQTEITQVIGDDRLPKYDDRSSLPYIEAVYREVLRWHAVLPAGLPHLSVATDDDEFRGQWGFASCYCSTFVNYLPVQVCGSPRGLLSSQWYKICITILKPTMNLIYLIQNAFWDILETWSEIRRAQYLDLGEGMSVRCRLASLF
jgi:hypothetical protein